MSRRSQDAGDTDTLAHTGSGGGGVGVVHPPGGGSGAPFKEFKAGFRIHHLFLNL